MGEVYFIQSGDRPFVKIGWALSAESRIQALQCGNPDELLILGTVPGTMADEGAWRARFAAYHERGEWFRLSPELAEAITRRLVIAAEIWQESQPALLDPEDRVGHWVALVHANRNANRQRGEGAFVSKLTDEQVRAIRADKRSLRKIAADYGIATMTAHAIRARRTWRHVEDLAA